MAEIDRQSSTDSTSEDGSDDSTPPKQDGTSTPGNDEFTTAPYLQPAIELGHYVSNYAMSMISMVSLSSTTTTGSFDDDNDGRVGEGSAPTKEALQLALQDHDKSTSLSFEFPSSSSLPIPNALAQPTVPSNKGVSRMQVWSPLVVSWQGFPWILVQIPIFLCVVFIFCYLYYNRRTREQQKQQPKDPQMTLSSSPQIHSSPLRPGLTTEDHRSSRRFLSSPDRLSRVHPSMASGRSMIGGSSSRNLPPRSRSSTFDFFGMNDDIGEGRNMSRSNSLTRLGRGGSSDVGIGGGGPRRKRTGSVDLLLQGLGVVTGGMGGSFRNKNNTKRKLSFDESNHANRLHRFDGGGGDEDGVLYDEFGPITFSSQLAYHGPGCSTISYSTWTPPTTVSRKRSRKEGGGMAPPLPTSKNHGRLLASDVILKLRRTVILDVHKSLLSFVVPNPTTATTSSSSGTPQVKSSKKFDFTLPVPIFSTHVVPPALGGVLNVYVLGSPKDEWMEYTFDSANQAAQFQLDLIAYQVLGNTLRNMYQVLSLVHQGSEAHDGQEFVLHDDQQIHHTKSKEGDTTESQKENNTDTDGAASAATTDKPTFVNAGVAWDDALRSLSSIPSVRIALERLWLHHRNHGFPATTTAARTGTGAAATATTASGAAGKKTKGSKSKTKKNQAAGGTAATTTLETSVASPSLDIHQASLTEEYVNKRLLLGPVDFFRLFVPTLPETAIPMIDESNKDRMEQLLRWRKRVARGAVLVRSYVLSHKVVNESWTLPLPVSFPMPANLQPFRKRLAYDDNEDNNRRDFTARNEYYEATVSRDVLCHVRPDDYFFPDDVNNGSNSNIDTQWKFPPFWGGNQFFSQRHLVLSPCQAYSLVAAHIFQLPDQPSEDCHSHPLQAIHDPVAAIPSLFDLISKHPEVDFLISAFYPQARSVAVVACYVRSLPKGIDPAFDNVMDRFTNGTKETRDRKLHIMVQLGPYVGLSFIGWAVLRVMSFLLSLTRKGRESPMGYETTRDRSPFPALRLMHYANTHHFGGALQTDPSMPQNYVAVTSSYDSVHMPNTLARVLFLMLENGALKDNIMDFSFVLEGEEEDELPERALSTIRLVHVESNDVAFPVSLSANWKIRSKDMRRKKSDGGDFPNRFSLMVTQTFHDVVAIMGSPLRPSSMSLLRPSEAAFSPLPEESSSEEVEEVGYNDAPNHVNSDDPMEIAANLITDILADTSIPVRQEQLRRESAISVDCTFDDSASTFSSIFQVRGHDDTKPVSILSRVTRQDMKRFFVASNFDPKVAAVRLVETAAWHGITFPIEKRRCRLELQNGQFFQQGKDLNGNPVFYFRNMCLGPWRGNVDAAISAVLYRLNKSLQELAKVNPNVQCVLIVLMGRPYGKLIEKKEPKVVIQNIAKADQGGSSGDAVVENGQDEGAFKEDGSTLGDMTLGVGHHEARSSAANWISNPRIDPNETWQVHTNKELILRLITILLRHYPERLSKVLVIAGKGSNSYYNGSVIAGRMALGTVLDCKATKAKIKFIKKILDLTRHVSETELVSIVGGHAPIYPSVFECR